MIKKDGDKIELTKSEFNSLRKAAARKGVVVNSISTSAELIDAIIQGLDDARAADMLRFLDRESLLPIIRDE